MSRKLRAIFIDVIKQDVFEVEVSEGEWDKLIDCDIPYPSGYLETDDMVLVDDNGLYRPEPIGSFVIAGLPHVYAGHGLILGVNKNNGETVNAHVTLDEIRQMVFFRPKSCPLPQPSFTVLSVG